MSLMNCKECQTSISDKALTCPGCGIQINKAPKSGAAKLFDAIKWVLVLMAICGMAILIYGYFVFSEGVNEVQQKYQEEVKKYNKQVQIIKDMENVRLSGLANIMFSTKGHESEYKTIGIIKNDNEYAIKDITLTCSYTGGSGSVISSNKRTIYKRINSNKQIEINDFSYGRTPDGAVGVYCEATNFFRDFTETPLSTE